MSAENRRRYEVADGRDARPASDAFTPDSTGPVATLAGRPLISNRGIPLNLDWVQQVRVNTSAVERRAQSHVARRTVKKDWQAAWLLRAISCMDLTTLSGDDTEERVRRLCAKARHPLQDDLVKRLGVEELTSRWPPSVCTTLLWRRRCGPSRVAACVLPRFPPDSPPAFLRWPNAWPKFAA